ncbi:MAG: hypothetical protein RRX93_06090, partial [Bacteroidales bacterium]
MRLSNLNIKSSVISKSILPFVGLLLLGVYLFCFWPYFVNLESKSFYSGVAAFLLPLWQQIGGCVEVLSRFCIQFYAYPWGIIGVLSLWAVVWYILCAKNLRLWAVLAWPVFLLLAKGNLPQVVFLMGLTLSLISLWGQKKIKNFYLSYGLWFLGSVLLYYFSGISSLFFSLPGACVLF